MNEEKESEYIVDSVTNKIHHINGLCAVPPDNIRRFPNLMEAIDAGFTKCIICFPGPFMKPWAPRSFIPNQGGVIAVKGGAGPSQNKMVPPGSIKSK